MSRADHREEATRDAIARTAAAVRGQAALSGVSMTQEQALARVRAARVRGDAIRENGNR
jgi:hypothetical protein